MNRIGEFTSEKGNGGISNRFPASIPPVSALPEARGTRALSSAIGPASESTACRQTVPNYLCGIYLPISPPYSSIHSQVE